MPNIINIYCDESCHLEHDNQNAMVIGALSVEKHLVKRIHSEIRQIKQNHNLNINMEIKWNKVSKSKVGFYSDIIKFFFTHEYINFRAVVIPDKQVLDHKKYHQTHNDWYYKMFFRLLNPLLDPKFTHNIYLDYKDTQGGKKVRKLHQILCNANMDFEKKIINNIQPLPSHEIELIGVTDLFIGALSYFHRGLNSNLGKLEIIELIKELSKYSLLKSTLPSEKKFNILIWHEVK